MIDRTLHISFDVTKKQIMRHFNGGAWARLAKHVWNLPEQPVKRMRELRWMEYYASLIDCNHWEDPNVDLDAAKCECWLITATVGHLHLNKHNREDLYSARIELLRDLFYSLGYRNYLTEFQRTCRKYQAQLKRDYGAKTFKILMRKR